MSAFPTCTSLNFLVFFISCSLQLISGFSGDSSGSKNATKPEAQGPFGSSNSSTFVIIAILIVVVLLLSFCLFKLWRKKKREEQYARLSKLFEEDDALELELGLRD